MADNKVKHSKKKNDNFSIRKLIYNDKYLIIFSIVTAVIIWVIASINLSPVTTKTITVPVTVDLSSSVAGKMGIKCFGESKIDVDVTVSCKKYLAKDISADDLAVTLQLSSVTSTGLYDIPIKVENKSNEDFDINSYSPSSYGAFFDVEDEKTMDIQIEYSENDIIADGYVKGEELLSENTAVLTGPKSYLSEVEKLVAKINIDTKLSETQTVDINPIPIDKNGKEVNLITVQTESKNPTLTIPVLKKTQLDVVVSFTNKPEGITDDDFTVYYSQNKVNAGILENTGVIEANIGNIDFSQLNIGRNEFTFEVSNLDSVVVIDDIREITVVVNIPKSFEQKQIAVSSKNLTITNVPDGYIVTVTKLNTNQLTVIGESSSIKNDDISVGMVVDLSAVDMDIKKGTAEYSITATIEGSKNCWIYGDYIASITLAEK